MFSPNLPGKITPLWKWVVLGVFLELCCLGLIWVSQRPHPLFPFLLVQGLAFAVYFVGVSFVLKNRNPVRGGIPLILGFALLFSVTLLPTAPILDDDLYRYVWDGRVLAHGISPYAYSPDAPELASLRDTVVFPRINYRFIPTVYPPFAQGVFVLAQWLPFGEILSVKILIIGFYWLSVAFLLMILKELGLPLTRVLLFCWNPLVLKEIANSGHVESVLIALFLSAFCLALTGRQTASAFCLALSVLTKYVPLLWVPFFAKGWDIQKWKRVQWAVFFGAILLAYLPLMIPDNPARLAEGLATYAGHWEFNAGIYWVLKTFFLFFHPAGEWIAKGVSVGIILIFIVYRTRLSLESGWDLLFSAFLTLGWTFLLFPVVNPWYVVILIPFLCFFPSPGWLAFTAMVQLSYLYYLNQEPVRLLQVIEYVFFFAILFRYGWKGSNPETGFRKREISDPEATVKNL